MSPSLGVSGRIARYFLENRLTPLLAVTALLAGLFAVSVTPREEEPQIDVTMANVIVPYPGASAAQVEHLVATPMEKVLSEISGVKHLYSVSRPGVAVLTVQFDVGVKRQDALVRLYNTVYSNADWRPEGTGILAPLIKPKGIDDVPVLGLTLWSQDPTIGAHELGAVARALGSEIRRVPGTRNVDIIGAEPAVLRVDLDPARLARAGLAIDDVAAALTAAGVARQAGDVIDQQRLEPVQAGHFLAQRDDVALLVLAYRDGHPVYLDDVAVVSGAPAVPTRYATFGRGAAAVARGLSDVRSAPAVTIAVAKKPGANAIDVTSAVLDRIQRLKGVTIPAHVEVTTSRNYGVTANDKAKKLIEKLLFATTSVVILVLLAVGRREAVVVGAAVLVTLAATLFASWAWGFTINRVSLFALIFAIGILVDDAIVVVENVHRHLGRDGRSLTDTIAQAVDEVGGPTILATFTVIAALLPMAFVSGLMGPYMSPIPINASMGMLLSLAIALIFTPWLCRKVYASVSASDVHSGESSMDRTIHSVYERIVRPFLDVTVGRARRHRLYLGIVVAIGVAVALAAVQLVVLKMLPFDNKSEFQVVVDMPEGTTLEDTHRVLDGLAAIVRSVPEVTDWQSYAGTSAPINFNGLVRQYYLRADAQQGDLVVNLVDKSQRSRKSHDIALALRPRLAAEARRLGARSVQVIEVPPGPPVQAPLVAEVYGADRPERLAITRAVRRLFDQTPDIVDTGDTLVAADATQRVLSVDRAHAATLGVRQQSVVYSLAAGLGGLVPAYLHPGAEEDPIGIRLGLSTADRTGLEAALALPVHTEKGTVPLSEVVHSQTLPWDGARFHKDLLPVEYVTGDMAGRLDSPLYGMFRIGSQIAQTRPGGVAVRQNYVAAPTTITDATVRWDGEWTITYETFRDMGLAYSVGLVLIYLLVVAQFGSYGIPLVIMAPIPLTIIGVMPGHALLGAQFTATSMIGMIALAGIIVRNSILLVDFINSAIAAGTPMADAVVQAAAIRTRPILLTGIAAMTGAFFIIDDPIFNGLAISLIFGILVSTALTLVLIPVLYFGYLRRSAQHADGHH